MLFCHYKVFTELWHFVLKGRFMIYNITLIFRCLSKNPSTKNAISVQSLFEVEIEVAQIGVR